MPTIAIVRGHQTRRVGNTLGSIGGYSMIGKTFVGDPRPGLIGRSVSGAALLVLTMSLALPAANASEQGRHDPDRVVNAESGNGRSNRQQLSLAVGPSAKSPTAGATAEQIGI